jgi:hypothetical protein
MIAFHLGKDRAEPLLPGMIFLFYQHSISLTDLLFSKIASGFVHYVAKIKQDVESFITFYLSLLQKHVVTKVPDSVVSAMIREAVSLECQLLSDLDEMSGGAGFVQVTADIKVEFEKVKNGVRARAADCAKVYGPGVSANVPTSPKNPMEWVNGNLLSFTQPINNLSPFLSK